ncbi:MAG: c-type cytochrome [Chitinophagaceae bacterium]|nr:c-type cytochrome [Chitinophagaceae bacterium]
MRNKMRYIISFVVLFLLFALQPAFAAGPPSPSLFSNPLAVVLIVLMILLLIVIGILANILIGAAEIKLKKKKAKDSGMAAGVMVILSMLIAPAVIAQDQTVQTAATTAKTIGGMNSSTFYLMAVILFLELLVIIAMLINIKFLLRTEKEKLITATATPEEIKIARADRLSWWDRFNKLRPVSQEADLDLGHDYDGIRELNNRLPPWWLYGFYVTIIFAVIYLWRFHVSHTGPSSKQEYETSVANAEIRVKEYLKRKGEAVDENTVTLLTSADDINAGKAIFTDPSKCTACHGADGGGNAVGPNLTDEYWLYGGGIKDIFKTIKYGTSKGMRSWKDDLSPKQMAQLTSYVRSLQGTKPANPRDPQGELYKEEANPVKPVTDTVKTTAGKLQP